MRTLPWTILCLTLIIGNATHALSACVDYGSVVYVKANATGTNDGTSWANAYTTLQNALNIACTCSNVTQVWVAAGTYYPDQGTGQTNNSLLSTFQLCNNVSVYGGFFGTETTVEARNWLAQVTILHGDIDGNGSLTNNAYHVVTGSGTNNTAALDGFTITGGNAINPDTYPHKHGGGLVNISGSPTIANCIFTSNTARDGGAMFNATSSNPIVTNCTFMSNTGTIVVGGMLNISSHPVLTFCHFISNVGGIETGGMGNTLSNPTLINCSFKGNNSTNGQAGAVHNWVSSPTFINCLFSGNRAGGNGGAVFATTTSNPQLINCTFSGNSAGTNGGGVFTEMTSTATLVNCVIWNNRASGSTTSTSASVFNAANGGTSVISYSLIANSGGSGSWNSAIGTNGGNNIDANPLFVLDVSPATAPTTAGNLRLTSPSPARNSGNNAANAQALDLDGNARLVDQIDMGPYEFAPPPVISCDLYNSNVIYVRANATGNNSGTNWTNAFTHLQDALSIACTCDNINQVWVAANTYYPDLGANQTNNLLLSTFQLCNGLAVYGGFAGTEITLEARNLITNTTTLHGDIDGNAALSNNAYHVVTGSGTNNTAVLDGFTITGGNAINPDTYPHKHGGGLVNISGSPTIANCIFSSNTGRDGGAMFNATSSNPIVTNCTFSNNTGTVVVGGMLNISSHPVLTFCHFISNVGGIETGGMGNTLSNPTLINCSFKGNNSTNGQAGAVHNWVSSPTFINCLFSGNRAGGNGGGVFATTTSNPQLINCTFSGNSAGTNGGGVFTEMTSTATLVNCVIWNNRASGSTTSTSASVFNAANGGSSVISYSLIANSGGSGSWNSAIGTNGGNNIDANPLFVLDVSPATAPTTSGNLRLSFSSPAREAGNNAANAQTLDLDGNARFVDQIDMGPYEGVPPPVISCDLYVSNVLYVKGNAAGSNNGLSWANAFNHLQDALAIACTCSAVTQVWVAAGTYYPDQGITQSDNSLLSTFQLCNGVAIYGGFAGNEMTLAARNWVSNTTTLHGDIDGNASLSGNAYHVVTGSGTNNSAVLDGFNITAGNASDDVTYPHKHGGGVLNITGSPTIANCNITANVARDGGGMYNSTSSSPVLTNCSFNSNTGTIVVGGIMNTVGSHPILTDCDFISNVGGIEIGAMGNTVSNPVFVNCTFSGNNSTLGQAGVCHNWAASPVFINCLFSGNRAGAGGGAFFNGAESDPEFINCTFSGNKATTSGGVLFNTSSSHPILANCILWDNLAGASTITTSASVFNENGATATFSYSLIANSGGSSSWNGAIGINAGNNIATNPLFIVPVNPANAPTTAGNLRLNTTSPAKDSGNTGANFVEEFDLDGNPRRAGCIDMGAYEFVQQVPTCPGFQLVSLEIVQPCLTAGEDSLYYYPTWGENLELSAMVQNGMTIPVPAKYATWTSSHPARATVVNGRIEALTPGKVAISATKNAITGSLGIRVIAPALPPVFQVVPVSLSEPDDECAVADMPVLIIRYIPTADGVNLDVTHASDFAFLNPKTVAQMEDTLLTYDKRVRFALEEGSRFRDYGLHTKDSYMGYRVVDIISVYEPLPRGHVRYYDVNGLPVFENDHFSIFERFDIEHYINDLGVKEVWLWLYAFDSGYPSYDPLIHTPCKFRFGWESNMSSPTTGDVSNSNQDPNDLPVYDQTYILYGQNIRRSQAEALHNHGHQIERMLPYVNSIQDGNTDLFWKKFVGQDINGNFTTGRCGWTHMPPNTIVNYDYLNATLVASDIKNWTPAGGSTTMVNVNTWGNANFIFPGTTNFPQRTETRWYIYWFQSIPGNANTIPHGANFITNWWDVIADWDKAVTTGIGLHAPTPAPNLKKTVVVNTGNSGYGTLRSVIACASSGSTIKFATHLASQTFSVLTPLSINKTLTIEGNTAPGAILNASASTYAFDVLNTGTLNLRSLQILCGTSPVQSGLRNFGSTTLFNMSFETQLNTPAILNRSSLLQKGLSTIMHN